MYKHMYVNGKCVIYSNTFINLITNFITTLISTIKQW